MVCGTTTEWRYGKSQSKFDVVALVDLGGVEGSIGSGQVSWTGIPLLPRPGDKVYCPILRFDRPARTVVLGGPLWNWEQWQGVEERFPVGTHHRATVTKVVNFGAFVTLAPGVDGLVAVQELSPELAAVYAAEPPADGQVVEVVVLAVPQHPQQLLLRVGPVSRIWRPT